MNLKVSVKLGGCLSLLQVMQMLGGYRTVLHILSVYPFGSQRLGKGVGSECSFLLCLPKEKLGISRQLKFLTPDLCAD